MTKSGAGRRRTGAGWVIVLAALAMPVSAEPEGELVFAVPEGWTDISPGADLKGVPELPPDVLAQARNGRHARSSGSSSSSMTAPDRPVV